MEAAFQADWLAHLPAGMVQALHSLIGVGRMFFLNESIMHAFARMMARKQTRSIPISLTSSAMLLGYCLFNNDTGKLSNVCRT